MTARWLKPLRCDLAIAVDTCSKPTFFDCNNIPWSLTPDISPQVVSNIQAHSRQSGFEGIMPHSQVQPELAAVWVAMSIFCSSINAAFEERRASMTEQVFLHSMGSVMYRLLHLQYAAGSPDEAFRLALLAFSSPVFLNWNRDERLSLQFMDAFQHALAKLHRASPAVNPQDFLWLCMVGALSTSLGTDRMAQLTGWLRECTRQCHVLTWNAMRDLLGSFLWIGSVYDYRGKFLFESILT